MTVTSEIKTGDVIALRYAKPGIPFRAIEWATGGLTHHNEMIVETQAGLCCAYARSPHLGLIPLQDRLDEVKRGKIVMAVLRPTACLQMTPAEYDLWRARAAGAILSLCDVKIPYDWSAIWAQAMNYIGSLLPIKLATHWKGNEHKVFCTESVDIAWTQAGHNPLREWLPPQQFFAPVHIERLWRNGALFGVQDFGLAELLAKKWE